MTSFSLTLLTRELRTQLVRVHMLAQSKDSEYARSVAADTTIRIIARNRTLICLQGPRALPMMV